MAFKITQLTKDLGIKSKEITELMTARGMECKTTQKTLTPREFDVVFEVLTRASQINGIDDYLFGDTYIPTKAPEKKPKPEKAAEAAAPEVAAPKTAEVAAPKKAAVKKAEPESKEPEKKEPEKKDIGKLIKLIFF
ncbi:MAG: hypothetical protein J6A84_03600 [Clostridia bacterium]|nr:hypothetical protein [Clostridia bacterium]